MPCHVCGIRLQLTNDTMIKCKLCCDGLEQETCKYCARLYYAYKKTFSTAPHLAKLYFLELQALRSEGIKARRLQSI